MLPGGADRRHRGVSVTLIAVLGVAEGCAGKSAAAGAEEAQNTPTSRDGRTLTIDRTRCDGEGKRSDHEDLNHDGRADLIALRRDIHRIDPMEIPQVEVDVTVFDGESVHRNV